MRRRWVGGWSCCLAGLLISSAVAGDWPQILGPNRDGTAEREPPVEAWPPAGPRKLWTVRLGTGFAGPAVQGDRVVVFHRIESQERVQCHAAADGKLLWQADFPASYVGGVNPDNGPRCVPLIHDGHVYLFGAAGDVHCVTLDRGEKVWSRAAYADFRGQEGYFGAGATPIAAAGNLLVNVGGKKAGIVAFDLGDGSTKWQATDERASYSSPTMAQIGGEPYAIFVTRLQCVAVHPTTGKILFQLPFGKTGPTVNAATPLVLGDHLFLSASYGVGARLLRLQADPKEVWGNDDTMSSQYTTCVVRDGDLFGIHGREDFGNGELRCVVAATGQVRWTVPGFGVGHLTRVGDRLLILTTEGVLVLAAARPDRYEELARATISRGVTRALPAVAGGRFYVRDNTDRGGDLICLELAAR